jgi:hypothetical protein
MTGGWIFTQHACRICMGTVMQSGASYICTVCRAEAAGSPTPICGCGAEIISPGGFAKNAGFRCVANPTPTPACPSRVVIAFDPALAAA